jgi:RNA polymerase sigma-70 factor (ECF subfamily)
LERETETELARRLMTGDAGAFDQFVEHFRRKIFTHAWLMCGDREDAEEVTQEALLRVFQNFSQLRDPETVKTWVFRIARNECLMKRRKSVFAPARELSLDEFIPAKGDGGGPARIEIADWSGLPENQLLQQEMREVLGRAITELPENYRSVMLLRDMDGLSTQETAGILDLSEDVVRTRLHRARLALRQKIDSYLAARPATSAAPAGSRKG